MENPGLTIFNLLKRNAEDSPGVIAIAAPECEPITWRQLFIQAGDVRGWLNARGFTAGDRLAIVLPNGPDMAVAFLSIASFAASAPLNPAYNASEFDFYLSDLDARAVIVQAGCDSPVREVAARRGIHLVELIPSRDSEAGLFGLTDENTIKPVASIEARQEDEALVLHTSGTTSRPKMVPLTQANLCASARHISQTLSLTPQDRCLNVMPLFHIHGLVGVLLSSVFAGASVTCTPGFDVGRFFEWFQVFQPTWYSAVPTMHQAILGQLAGLQNRPGFTGLRFIRSSSASLPPSVMAELEACFGVPVIESYGMTEAAHQMASNPLPPRPRKPGSVGVAAGPEIAVMNERGDLLPGGERGQIVIRGANVMQGYANNPQANQDAFKGGWFLTGDEGYLDEDGYLFITGRLKEMINRGGEKVTPREVDEVFLEHPAVAQAVTFAVAHPTLGEDIAIAVVLKESKQATEKELRSYAMERLAGYKVPSQVLILDHLPKGPTGKIQRIGLHEKLAPMLQAAHQAPTTPLEEALTRLWREVLNINDVSVRDNFFYLGGDSLLGALLNARIQAAFQLKLPSNAIFHSPTILDQAELIQELLLQEIEAMSEEEAIRLSESGR